jgi:hypothetical protein
VSLRRATKHLLFLGAAILFLGAVAFHLRSRNPESRIRDIKAVPAGSPPEALPSDGAFVVRVLSERDGRPIAGAKVTYSKQTPHGSVPETIETHTDAEGKVTVPFEPAGSLEVRAKGHLGSRAELPLQKRETRIRLVPTATIELQFLASDGKPVEGVDLQLEADATVSEAVAQDVYILADTIPWRQKSTSGGKVTWQGLPPAEGYRWIRQSTHLIKQPAPAAAKVDEFAQVIGAPARGESAAPSPSEPVSLQRGQVLKLVFRVFSSGRVTGAVPVGTGRGQEAYIRLFHFREYRGEDGTVGARGLSLESIAKADASGAFSFERVQAGSKQLIAQWRNATSIFFSKVEFDLLPDEEKSLGVLQAMPGHSVQVTVRLDAEESLRKQLLERNDLDFVLKISSRRTLEHPGGETFHQSTLLRAEEATVITALGGFLELTLEVRTQVDGVTWAYDTPKQFAVTPSSPIVLKASAAALLPVKLAAGFPAGQPGCSVKAYLFSKELDRRPVVGPSSLNPEGEGARSALGTVPLSPGDYIAWFMSGSAGGTQSNYFAEARFEVRAGRSNECSVVLGPGAIVRGRSLNILQQRQPSTGTLRVNASPTTIRGIDPAIWLVKPDSEGRFVLSGLPPDCDLQVSLSVDRIRTGGAGTETDVEIEVRN